MAEPLTPDDTRKTDPCAGGVEPAAAALPEALRAHLRSARELDRELRESAGEGAFPTAVPVLDRLLAGGLPRGQLVELVGARTSGRFSTLLAALAAATGMGEAAALVDLGDGLDPDGGGGAGDRPRAPPLGAPGPAEGGAGGGRDAARQRLPPGGARPRAAAGARRPGGRVRLAAPGARRPRPRRGAAGGLPLPGERHGRRRGAARPAAGAPPGAAAAPPPGCSTASPRASSWRSAAAGSPDRARSSGCWWRICRGPPCRRACRRGRRRCR